MLLRCGESRAVGCEVAGTEERRVLVGVMSVSCFRCSQSLFRRVDKLMGDGAHFLVPSPSDVNDKKVRKERVGVAHIRDT